MTEIDRSQCKGTRHGTRQAYLKSNCRCEDARRATTSYRKRLAAGLQPSGVVSVIPSRRRLQALQAIGWRLRVDLQPRLGVGVNLERTMITRTLAKKIADLYDDLQGRPGPSDRARVLSRARGYVPPLAWEDIDDLDEVPNLGGRDYLHDDTVVRMLIAGQKVEAHTPDRIEAVRQLIEMGVGTGAISARLRMSSTRLFQIIDQLRSVATRAQNDDLQEAA